MYQTFKLHILVQYHQQIFTFSLLVGKIKMTRLPRLLYDLCTFLCERGRDGGREERGEKERENFSIARTGLIFTKLGFYVMPILMESIPFCRDVLILA